MRQRGAFVAEEQHTIELQFAFNTLYRKRGTATVDTTNGHTDMGTLRQQMIDVLRGKAMDLRELSQALGIREKEVVLHLPHIAKSVVAKKMKWQVQPACCENCNYSFKDRRRLTPPSKCPRCRTSRIRGPWYQITC